MDTLNRADIEVIPAAATFLPRDDQPGIFEDPEMLHYGRSVQPGQALSQFPGGHRRVPQ